MTDMTEAIAARLWKAESEGTGAPASLVDARSPDAFLDQSPELRARWHKFARAAIAAIEAADRRILASGQLDPETLERAAQIAKLAVLQSSSKPYKTQNFGLPRSAYPHEMGDAAAAAIRAMINAAKES